MVAQHPTPVSVSQSIVERALFPDEGLAFPNAVLSSRESDRQAAEQLFTRWQKRIALRQGTDEAFEDRLQQLELNTESAIDYLTARQLPPHASLPSWAQLLEDVLEPEIFAQPVLTVVQLQAWTDEELQHYDAQPDSIPLFPEFLHPFVSWLLRKLQVEYSDIYTLLSLNAIETLGRYVVSRLSQLVARTIAYEVKQRGFRNQLSGETSELRYQYFVGQVLGTPVGLTELLLRYPVLGRFLAIATEQILNSTTELLSRFKEDRAKLSSVFGCNAHSIESLFLGLSDAHQGGRTVALLRFSDRTQLIYKPRSLAIDRAFQGFIEWLNQTAAVLPLKILKVLDCDQYGWTEFVATEDCESKAAVARFYQRQGIHVALMHFLCGVDFHYENFIPSGEYPVPIDLEGLLASGVHVASGDWQRFPKYLLPPGLFSLLATSMPTYWRAGTLDQLLFAGSGINGSGDRPWHSTVAVWKGINTDRLTLKQETLPLYFKQSSPRLNGDPVSVDRFLPDVVQGFVSTYRTLLEHRDDLLSNQSSLQAFYSVTTRTLLRDTNDYAEMLAWSLAPDQLTSGAAFFVALESLSDLSPTCASLNPTQEILKEERQCLQELDIPSFYGSPFSVDIYSSRGTVFPDFALNSSFTQMQQRLREASEEDLIWQAELLRVSLALALSANEPATEVYPPALPKTALTLQSLQLGDWAHFSAVVRSDEPDVSDPIAKLRSHAIALGDRLADLALNHAQGTSWLSLGRVSRTSPIVSAVHHYPWQAMGATGTSLFFANLAQQTQEQRYDRLARGGLKFTRAMLAQFTAVGLEDDLPLSGYQGIGSLIYGLTECGRCLADESLIDQAFALALKITPEKISRESNPDILGGSAGALLTLLHLHQLRPDNRLLDRALELAKPILNSQTSGEAAGWVVPGFERPVMGMGHGAAGITYALLQLYAVTQDHRLKCSAGRGLAFEQENFCTQAQDWPDFRQPIGTVQFMTGWCSGAPGIGLARLGSLGILEQDTILLADIERAIAATQKYLGTHQHHLCCGEAGRIAFLAKAARELDRPELWKTAMDAAIAMVRFYEKRGYWRLQEFSERSVIPGLFDGVAGIGLTLLWLLEPDSTSQAWLLK